MKSPMIEALKLEDDEGTYSELQVLQSGAGWYIGTVWKSKKDKHTEPGSRDSGYFPSKEKAQAELDSILDSGDVSTLRKNP